MSVRAHRVLEIKTVGESFNLWHAEALVKWLDENTSFYEPLNIDACGLTELSVEDIKKILKLAKVLELEAEDVKDFKEALERAKKEGDEYVQYYCY